MAWIVEFDKKAAKEFRSLGNAAQKQIHKFILKLMEKENPRVSGEALKGNLQSFWRYRVGDYRLICDINDGEITILVISIGHRKEIYK